MAERGRTDSRGHGTKRSGGSATTSTKAKSAGTQRGVATSVATPKAPPKASGSRFTARAGILTLVLVLLVASYTGSFHAWWNQKQEIAALEVRKAAAEDEIAELQDIEQRWNDPAFIRNQARERFGWVMPGEVGYRVIGLDGEVKGDGPSLAAPTALPKVTWVDRLRTSVDLVDNPPPPEETESLDPDAVLGKKKGS